jgi:LPS-assembly lipoprotein
MPKQLLATAGSIALCLLLSACGFALRGSAELPAVLQPLQLENVDAATPLGRELLRVFASNKVALADPAEGALYSLAVATESGGERALSVNANARAGEYELSLGTEYQLQRNGVPVAAPQALTLRRVYLADPENAIAKNEEAELIRTEMRRELALQLLRRLQAFQP